MAAQKQIADSSSNSNSPSISARPPLTNGPMAGGDSSTAINASSSQATPASTELHVVTSLPVSSTLPDSGSSLLAKVRIFAF